MKIHFAETTWHTLQDIVAKSPTFQSRAQAIKISRKDLIAKVMAGVYRAVESELIRMEMSGETANGSVVISMDVTFDTIPYSNTMPKNPKSLIAELDDILNKRRSAKKLVEY